MFYLLVLHAFYYEKIGFLDKSGLKMNFKPLL